MSELRRSAGDEGLELADSDIEVEPTEPRTAGVVLLQRRVDARGRRHHQLPHRTRHVSGDEQQVPVRGREPLTQDPRPLLGDPADLVAAGVVDGEVPRAPVLRIDGAEGLVRRPVEPEALLPDDVLLHDLADARAVRVENLDRRLEHLRRANELEYLRSAGVAHLQLVREELIDARDQAQELARLRLPLLTNRAHRRAVLVGDLVLVGHLDELRLLADDHDIHVQQIRHGGSSPSRGRPSLSLVRRSLCANMPRTRRPREPVIRCVAVPEPHAERVSSFRLTRMVPLWQWVTHDVEEVVTCTQRFGHIAQTCYRTAAGSMVSPSRPRTAASARWARRPTRSAVRPSSSTRGRGSSVGRSSSPQVRSNEWTLTTTPFASA